MSLPDDFCRCHDDACVQRESCARWMERESLGQRVVHAASLRMLDPLGDYCVYWIEADRKINGQVAR
mgnify:CR=1 FL=1